MSYRYVSHPESLIRFVLEQLGQKEPIQARNDPCKTCPPSMVRHLQLSEKGSMKPCRCDPDMSEVAHQILTYLIENPEAQDTVEGIVDWWLLDREIQRQTAKVNEALSELVAKRFILARKGKDSRIHYRINRSKVGQIRDLIKQKSR